MLSVDDDAQLPPFGSTREHNRIEASKSQVGGPKINKDKKKEDDGTREKSCVRRRDTRVGQAGGRVRRGWALFLHTSIAVSSEQENMDTHSNRCHLRATGNARSNCKLS